MLPNRFYVSSPADIDVTIVLSRDDMYTVVVCISDNIIDSSLCEELHALYGADECTYDEKRYTLTFRTTHSDLQHVLARVDKMLSGLLKRIDAVSEMLKPIRAKYVL